jgi:hypothetical protein
MDLFLLELIKKVINLYKVISKKEKIIKSRSSVEAQCAIFEQQGANNPLTL